MPRRPKRLTREGEPKQKTDKGLEIPIPQREDFFSTLKKLVPKSGSARRSKK